MLYSQASSEGRALRVRADPNLSHRVAVAFQDHQLMSGRRLPVREVGGEDKLVPFIEITQVYE